MKNICISFLLLLAATAYSSAQELTFANLFDGKTKVTFLGYDFTHAKFVGGEGFIDAEKIKDQYIPALNRLIQYEPDKFSLQAPLKLTPENYETYVDHHIELNKSISVDGMITETPQTLDVNLIPKFIAAYDLKDKDGIGISYIIENLNKNTRYATLYIVFFDIKTGKLLKVKESSGEAGGFGWRNYWAGAFYDVLKKIKSGYYPQWKKDNMKKK